MKKLYKNKYRVDSHRLPRWDYARNGKYFVTMCVKDMKCILGNVVDAKMVLSDFGKIVEEQWFRSFEMRKELFYDEFVIMPNHIHAILVINHPHIQQEFVSENLIVNDVINEMHLVPEAKNKMPIRHPHSISSFMAGFKSACYSPIDDLIDIHNDRAIAIANTRSSSNGKEYSINFLPLNTQLFYKKYNRRNRIWQTNYHDHIIRNDGEFWRIKDYIINNPAKWAKDVFYKKYHV